MQRTGDRLVTNIRRAWILPNSVQHRTKILCVSNRSARIRSGTMRGKTGLQARSCTYLRRMWPEKRSPQKCLVKG